jgi:hypothetical protein
LSLVKSGGIGDALTPLLVGQRINDQVRRADEAPVHSSSSLDAQQSVHQSCINTPAKVGQGFGQHKALLRAVQWDCLNTTGLHDGKVGTQAVTDGVI